MGPICLSIAPFFGAGGHKASQKTPTINRRPAEAYLGLYFNREMYSKDNLHEQEFIFKVKQRYEQHYETSVFMSNSHLYGYVKLLQDDNESLQILLDFVQAAWDRDVFYSVQLGIEYALESMKMYEGSDWYALRKTELRKLIKDEKQMYEPRETVAYNRWCLIRDKKKL